MQQQLAKMPTSFSALEDTSEPKNRKQIAALAYKFWQARGCPDGTPEEDWFRAEREIAKSIGLGENTIESRHPAEWVVDAEEADSSLLRFPVRSEVSQAAHAGASRRA
jgi:hypothetical protein